MKTKHFLFVVTFVVLFVTACSPRKEYPFQVIYTVKVRSNDTHLVKISYQDSTEQVWFLLCDTAWTKEVRLGKGEEAFLTVKYLHPRNKCEDDFENDFPLIDYGTLVSVKITHGDTTVVDSGQWWAIATLLDPTQKE